MREGNVFTGVYQSTGDGGGYMYVSTNDHQVSLAEGGYVQGEGVGMSKGREWVCPGEGVGIPGPMVYPPHPRQYWHLVVVNKTHTVGKRAVHILLECF